MKVSEIHILYLTLGVLISSIYHIAIYKEVISLSANPELRYKFLHPKTFIAKISPILKLVLIFGFHLLCGWLYFKAMNGTLIANFIVAELILFIPFNALMSTIFIKSLGRITCGISIIIQLLVFLFLQIGGAL